MAGKKLLVVVNPVSGTGTGPAVWASVKGIFEQAQVDCEVHTPDVTCASMSPNSYL